MENQHQEENQRTPTAHVRKATAGILLLVYGVWALAPVSLALPVPASAEGVCPGPTCGSGGTGGLTPLSSGSSGVCSGGICGGGGGLLGGGLLGGGGSTPQRGPAEEQVPQPPRTGPQQTGPQTGSGSGTGTGGTPTTPSPNPFQNPSMFLTESEDGVALFPTRLSIPHGTSVTFYNSTTETHSAEIRPQGSTTTGSAADIKSAEAHIFTFPQPGTYDVRVDGTTLGTITVTP